MFTCYPYSTTASYTGGNRHTLPIRVADTRTFVFLVVVAFEVSALSLSPLTPVSSASEIAPAGRYHI